MIQLVCRGLRAVRGYSLKTRACAGVRVGKKRVPIVPKLQYTNGTVSTP